MNFITRKEDKIYDGDKEFRFISFNVPNLHINEDPSWHLPTDWEQEDAIKSVALMGGQVIRTYTFSVGQSPNSVPRHVVSPGVFTEELFVCMDKALELCHKYEVRLIIPFVDQWEWWGGIKTYAQFRGKEEKDFWSDPEIIEDFKKTVEYVINRTNTFTGIKYMDDPAILAWETGNELFGSQKWTDEIAAYIKSLDQNHLVVDGHYGIYKASVENPDIDIVSNHYYRDKKKTYAKVCEDDRNMTKGKKPFIIGEFGLTDTQQIKDCIDTAIENGTAGAMIWSLRYRKATGGFYSHYEYDQYYSYHFPGFLSGEAYDEINILKIMREAGFKIQGLPLPEMEKPDAPYLSSVLTPRIINWRGGTGSAFFEVERAENENGPWEVIGKDLIDSFNEVKLLFSDDTAESGKNYYYRVRAKNESGYSDYSNIEGPVSVK